MIEHDVVRKPVPTFRHHALVGRRAILACLALSFGTARARTAPAVDRPDALAVLQTALKDRYPSVKAVLARRGGCSIFEYYKAGVDADTRLPLHSMTKSVLSSLVGLAIERGNLGIDQTLGELLPEARDPAIDPRVRPITIRQLLTMTAGFDAEAKAVAMPPPEAWRWALGRPILSMPGHDFRYDNENANLLSVILSRRLDQSADAFARKMLFDPLGIGNVTWTQDADGHALGAYGLALTARDMAKFGTLYLQHGRWTGRQIVPETFVAASTRKQNDGGTPFRGAYGYLWWIKPTKTGMGSFFAAGSDGQLIYVVPKLDLVVVLACEKSPPGGSVGFINDVVLAALATTAPALSCTPVSQPSGVSVPAVRSGPSVTRDR